MMEAMLHLIPNSCLDTIAGHLQHQLVPSDCEPVGFAGKPSVAGVGLLSSEAQPSAASTVSAVLLQSPTDDATASPPAQQAQMELPVQGIPSHPMLQDVSGAPPAPAPCTSTTSHPKPATGAPTSSLHTAAALQELTPFFLQGMQQVQGLSWQQLRQRIPEPAATRHSSPCRSNPTSPRLLQPTPSAQLFSTVLEAMVSSHGLQPRPTPSVGSLLHSMRARFFAWSDHAFIHPASQCKRQQHATRHRHQQHLSPQELGPPQPDASTVNASSAAGPAFHGQAAVPVFKAGLDARAPYFAARSSPCRDDGQDAKQQAGNTRPPSPDAGTTAPRVSHPPQATTSTSRAAAHTGTHQPDVSASPAREHTAMQQLAAGKDHPITRNQHSPTAAGGERQGRSHSGPDSPHRSPREKPKVAPSRSTANRTRPHVSSSSEQQRYVDGKGRDERGRDGHDSGGSRCMSRSRASSRGRDSSRGKDSSRGRASSKGRDSSRGKDSSRGRASSKGRDSSRGRDNSRGRQRQESRRRGKSRGRSDDRSLKRTRDNEIDDRQRGSGLTAAAASDRQQRSGSRTVQTSDRTGKSRLGRPSAEGQRQQGNGAYPREGRPSSEGHRQQGAQGDGVRPREAERSCSPEGSPPRMQVADDVAGAQLQSGDVPGAQLQCGDKGVAEVDSVQQADGCVVEQSGAGVIQEVVQVGSTCCADVQQQIEPGQECSVRVPVCSAEAGSGPVEAGRVLHPETQVNTGHQVAVEPEQSRPAGGSSRQQQESTAPGRQDGAPAKAAGQGRSRRGAPATDVAASASQPAPLQPSPCARFPGGGVAYFFSHADLHNIMRQQLLPLLYQPTQPISTHPISTATSTATSPGAAAADVVGGDGDGDDDDELPPLMDQAVEQQLSAIHLADEQQQDVLAAEPIEQDAAQQQGGDSSTAPGLVLEPAGGSPAGATSDTDAAPPAAPAAPAAAAPAAAAGPAAAGAAASAGPGAGSIPLPPALLTSNCLLLMYNTELQLLHGMYKCREGSLVELAAGKWGPASSMSVSKPGHPGDAAQQCPPPPSFTCTVKFEDVQHFSGLPLEVLQARQPQLAAALQQACSSPGGTTTASTLHYPALLPCLHLTQAQCDLVWQLMTKHQQDRDRSKVSKGSSSHPRSAPSSPRGAGRDAHRHDTSRVPSRPSHSAAPRQTGRPEPARDARDTGRQPSRDRAPPRDDHRAGRPEYSRGRQPGGSRLARNSQAQGRSADGVKRQRSRSAGPRDTESGQPSRKRSRPPAARQHTVSSRDDDRPRQQPRVATTSSQPECKRSRTCEPAQAEKP